MSSVLELRGVDKTFDGVQALLDISLDLKAGEVCCLLGENGSGKSTLIKTLSGIHAPDRGEILVAGVEQRTWRPMNAIAAGVDVVYQDFSLFPNLTVKENLALPGQVASRRRFVDWRGMRTAAANALAQLGISVDLDRRVEDLSVAQRQLVAIGRALLRDFPAARDGRADVRADGARDRDFAEDHRADQGSRRGGAVRQSQVR